MTRGRWRAAFAAIGFVCAGAAVTAAADEPPVPVEAFYRQADIGDIALSPSGRLLALASGHGGDRIALAVFDLQADSAPRIVARYNDADIASFRWVNDDYLVYTLTDRTLGGGDQRHNEGLFSVKADGTEPRQLIRLLQQHATLRGAVAELLGTEYRLLSVPETGGTEVIVGRWVRDADWSVTRVVPVALDVITRRTRALAPGAPEHAQQWWFDARGEAHVAAAVRDGRSRLYRRAPGQDEWKEFANFPAFEEAYWPHAVDTTGQLLVTTRRGAGGYSVLARFDPGSGQPDERALVSAPGFDYDGTVLTSHGTGRTIGVRVWTDAESTHWFDPRLRRVQQAADERLPGRVNRVICRRCDGDDMTVLVRSWSDQEPGELWLHHPAKASWQRVGRVRADIDPKRMATLDLHRIKARDGLELPVWLTLPRGADKKTPRPAVVLVHGGPWVRGGWWRWDANAQFLASRGYVVIEPEFRGSTGYGDRHFRAGWKQWGLAMQDDVADALKWAVAQGWVDGGRVCIAGASYGGFAVLSGLIRDPVLYRCGIAWVGVTDHRLLFDPSWKNDFPGQVQRHGLPVVMGDPVKDAAMFTATAPVEHAERIKAPVLLAYGGTDTRVPIEHGQRMRAALRAAGNEPEWIVYPDEWHGWYKAETRYDFARRVESFLAKHLK